MPVMENPFIIEDIQPGVDGGRYPVKREVGDALTVTATVFRDGHDAVRVMLKYREKYGADQWRETEMQCINPGLDVWRGGFRLEKNTRYLYTVAACTDVYRSWLNDAAKKAEAGQDIKSELLEGLIQLENTLKRVDDEEDAAYLKNVSAMLRKEIEPAGRKKKAAGAKTARAKAVREKPQDEIMKIFSDSLLLNLMERYAAREDLTEFAPALEVTADRVRARYAAWYELFPRSQGRTPGKSGTFKDCIARLPEIKSMGFDVVYLTPIHPIGITKRKGPNNSLTAGPDDPGSPYAIGNSTGGHKAVEPGLGTIEDFCEFERTCRSMGMELAMDFAINCSPDHPYVKEHPEWFFKRPDGSIKYAENPPKKYEDIYPLNFYAPDGAWESLWAEMRDIILFWVGRGVKIFRVDNPHTKPVPFWRRLIEDVQRENPDVVFLAEAFTRPPMMRALAKAGFTQSYTYFTWRNFKGDLTEYFTELTQSRAAEYMRGNLFANTPDILPKMLQEDGRAAFKMRLVLAATLSSVYGIYSGFELCENTPVAGKEEYLNSEKYEYVVWDWDRPGNIKDFITLINSIRRENPALHLYKNLRFYTADDENVLFYGKTSEDGKNTVLAAVNLDPFGTHDAVLHIPIDGLGIKPDETYELHNLITGERILMTGGEFKVSLNPDIEPAYIYRLERWVEKEEKFDYFGM